MISRVCSGTSINDFILSGISNSRKRHTQIIYLEAKMEDCLQNVTSRYQYNSENREVCVYSDGGQFSLQGFVVNAVFEIGTRE